MTGDEQVSKDNVLPLLWILVGVVLIFICLLFIAWRVVWRIRRNFTRTSEEPFYKSAAFHKGVNFLENGGKLLCLVGQWGSGKTSTAKQVYISVTNTHPIIIQNSSTFDVGNQPVIFDGAILKEITNVEKDQLGEKIKTLFENMSHSGTQPFIIITLDEDMEHLYNFVRSLLPYKEVKFIDLSKTLTKGDRTQILHSQLERFSPNTVFSKVEQLALKGKNHSLGYPEICVLFSRCSDFQNVGPIVFCNRPLQHLRMHLEDMHNSEDNEKFLMLAYISLNQMEINVNAPNGRLFKILRSCRPGTSEDNINETANDSNSGTNNEDRNREYFTSLLLKEFVVREADTSKYRLQHEVLKRMVLIVFGTYHFDKLLQHSNQEELKGLIEEKNTHYNQFLQEERKPVLEIKKEHWKQYQAKISLK
ncbi:uncharacterized protein LOC128171590 [Crassostrea angulata]|uniref:uncharacterized protein LOC128171590 n=1 Tax=Magallana angulata TaxID=2784310 RepID=UPI0022B1C998|nr:uncharacterized protein LOC128171590 [Crassostrea angulata]